MKSEFIPARAFENHSDAARSNFNYMNALLCDPDIDDSNSSVPAIEVAGPKERPKRILIADDDVLVRASVAAVLESEGYDVCGADNGWTALVHAVNQKVDLILLDLNMPGMDGWMAFSKLDLVRPLVPVIVITAKPNQYERAVQFGVDALMEKPLNFPVLLDAIARLTRVPYDRSARQLSGTFATEMLENDPPNTP